MSMLLRAVNRTCRAPSCWVLLIAIGSVTSSSVEPGLEAMKRVAHPPVPQSFCTFSRPPAQ